MSIHLLGELGTSVDSCIQYNFVLANLFILITEMLLKTRCLKTEHDIIWISRLEKG
jgi:hypothetical protein